MAKPDWFPVFKNTFVPQIKWDSEYAILSIAIIGTTITPWMQFLPPVIYCREGDKKRGL